MIGLQNVYAYLLSKRGLSLACVGRLFLLSLYVCIVWLIGYLARNINQKHFSFRCVVCVVVFWIALFVNKLCIIHFWDGWYLVTIPTCYEEKTNDWWSFGKNVVYCLMWVIWLLSYTYMYPNRCFASRFCSLNYRSLFFFFFFACVPLRALSDVWFMCMLCLLCGVCLIRVCFLICMSACMTHVLWGRRSCAIANFII